MWRSQKRKRSTQNVFDIRILSLRKSILLPFRTFPFKRRCCKQLFIILIASNLAICGFFASKASSSTKSSQSKSRLRFYLLCVLDANSHKIWTRQNKRKRFNVVNVLKSARITSCLLSLSSLRFLSSFSYHQKQFLCARFMCLIILRHHLRVVPFHLFLLGPCF